MATGTLELFDPPFQPSFAWQVVDTFRTADTGTEKGHRFTRALRDRKLREWRLRWENAEDTTLDYIRAFIEFHLGSALQFCWDLPNARLFTPGPAIFSATLADAGAGGSLANGTYNVRYTFENTNGETLAAPRTQIVVTGGPSGRIVFTAPPRIAADATLFGIYASLDPATELKVGTVAPSPGTFNIDSVPGAGALPTVNAMKGQVVVNATDAPRYRQVAAGVWLIEQTFRELLS